MEEKEISQAVISRLPRYFRYLGELRDQGIERVSSQELSDIMKVTASQIRQDFNNFGGFGQQGYGYNVEYGYRNTGSGRYKGNCSGLIGRGKCFIISTGIPSRIDFRCVKNAYKAQRQTTQQCREYRPCKPIVRLGLSRCRVCDSFRLDNIGPFVLDLRSAMRALCGFGRYLAATLMTCK